MRQRITLNTYSYSKTTRCNMMDKVDYQGACLLTGFIGAHVLAAIYDGEILLMIVGADVAIAARFFGLSSEKKT